MLKIVLVMVFAVCGGHGDETTPLMNKLASNEGRQKRLLFYDEEGNLVKTYTNPYLRGVNENPESIPIIGNFLNPFFSLLRPSTFGSTAITYMIPVSDEVIQQINSDPTYQNKLLFIPRRDPVIEPNTMCANKRMPIPSPKSCNTFLNCWDGWAFEQECPNGLLFSSEGYCDYYGKVDCSNRMIPSAPQPPPQCKVEFDSFRNPMNCNEFFICANRQPIRFKCPADLYYSEFLGVCDYAERVDCGSTPSAATEAPSKVIAPSDPVTSAPEIMKPAPPALMTEAPQTIQQPVKTVITNSVFNTQTWTSTHVAMSRQEAIRKLQLEKIANVSTA